MRIRSGSGIGDNLYCQAICRHYLKNGAKLEVCTEHPEIYTPLRDRVTFNEFSRRNIDILAHYTTHKRNQTTTQWEDVCKTANAQGAELKLDWTIQTPLADEIFERIGPFVATLLPRSPMGRKDGFGEELFPDFKVMEYWIEELGLPTVQVGAGRALYDLPAEIDLSNKTTITEMIDVVSASCGVIGYPSFFVPLAESLDLPGLFLWSRRGLESSKWFVNTITPQKLLHKRNWYQIDDQPGDIGEFVRRVRARSQET